MKERLRVLLSGGATMFGTMGTAIDVALRFDAVAYYVAVAVGTLGRQGVNCAFEAVERVTFALGDHFKRFRVLVSTYFADGHDGTPQHWIHGSKNLHYQGTMCKSYATCSPEVAQPFGRLP
jgi:hypothetical protein